MSRALDSAAVKRCYTRPMSVSTRYLIILLFPALALAGPPQNWPQQWPPGWYPPPYYPMPPPTAAQAGEPPAESPDSRARQTAAPQPDSTPVTPPAGPQVELKAEGMASDQALKAGAGAGSSTPADQAEPLPVTSPAVTDTSHEAKAATPAQGTAAGGPGADVPASPGQVMDPPAGAPSHATEVAADLDTLHQEALQAMRAGNYAEAFCIWRPLAQAGDPQALFSMGWMYHNGYGLAIDDAKTLALWQQAADKDFADAAFALGMLFSIGDGAVKRDLPRAVSYLLHAIVLGHEDARQMLRNLIADNPRAMADITADWEMDQWRLLATPARVRVEHANVRQKPSTQTRIVAKLEKGDRVLTLGQRGRWIQVVLPEGRLAWVYGSLLEPLSEATQVSLGASDQVSKR